MEIIFSLSQSGLSVFLTPVIKQLPKTVQAWFSSFLIWTLTVCFPSCLYSVTSEFFNLPEPAAARSLAIPRIPKQSARFGVIEISITFRLFFEK